MDDPKDHAAEWNISSILQAMSEACGAPQQLYAGKTCHRGKGCAQTIEPPIGATEGLVGCVLDDAARSGQISSTN